MWNAGRSSRHGIAGPKMRGCDCQSGEALDYRLGPFTWGKLPSSGITVHSLGITEGEVAGT